MEFASFFMKTATEIRNDFLDFFKKKQHYIVASAPIVPHNDPTLLFTNAGMNQFKNIFLGTQDASSTRIADTQKCLRVSGKHNDLESVGRDTYHHTFFEMLGNWSFGDYFKKEVIKWAWELLTEVWKLPKDKLWVTVFKGSKEDRTSADEEAISLWSNETDVCKEKILKFGKKDNFWEMGEVGPCGPCSEIHIDLGSQACDRKEVSGHKCSVNGDCARFIEIWNLVFIQYNRQKHKSLVSLPAKHIDTGLGFERLVAILQNKKSNYDTDLFTPIIQEISKIVGIDYSGTNNISDISFRVISDHIRALSVCFADGVLPGNSGRGYVLRRLLRRAARFGKQGLKMETPFIYRLVPVVADIFADVFPEIKQRRNHIELLVKSEEESFAHLLTRGIELFNQITQEVKEQGQKIIPGEKLYRLYHQDGFPKDLIDLMAREQNLEVDENGWEKAQQEHMEKSKSDNSDYTILPEDLEGLEETKFVGYTKFEYTSNVLKIIDNNKIILDKTPFYAESGGQVGDKGFISGKGFCFEVEDTQKVGNIIVHLGKITKQSNSLPERVTAYIDKDRRRAIMANHTATHLLHWALREVLGSHVVQQGSLVNENRLRFDISHPKKIEDAQLKKVEQLVNERISENIKVRKKIEDLKEARKKGVMALFGEKYGEKVRVVKVGHYSQELCGGCHAYFTGDLGFFKIISESSTQAGVRRIEAVTKLKALEVTQKQSELIENIKQHLKVTDEKMLISKIESLQENIKELKKKGTMQQQKDTKMYAQEILNESLEINNVKIITKKITNVSVSESRLIADMIKKSSHKAVGIIVNIFEKKAFILTFVSDKLLEDKKFHAGEIMKIAAPMIGGGGDPRRENFSQGQGRNIEQVDNMLDKLSSVLQKKMKTD